MGYGMGSDQAGVTPGLPPSTRQGPRFPQGGHGAVPSTCGRTPGCTQCRWVCALCHGNEKQHQQLSLASEEFHGDLCESLVNVCWSHGPPQQVHDLPSLHVQLRHRPCHVMPVSSVVSPGWLPHLHPLAVHGDTAPSCPHPAYLGFCTFLPCLFWETCELENCPHSDAPRVQKGRRSPRSLFGRNVPFALFGRRIAGWWSPVGTLWAH